MTAALAVAAHGIAGGGLPSGSVAVLLALLSITLGALVSTMRDAADLKALVVVLALGQSFGHALLAASGHAHGATTASAGLMVGAHLVAIGIGASLIAMGGRLCAAVSRVLLVASPQAGPPVRTMPAVVVRSADQPRQSARLLAASLSHRGPPVGFAH